MEYVEHRYGIKTNSPQLKNTYFNPFYITEAIRQMNKTFRNKTDNAKMIYSFKAEKK